MTLNSESPILLPKKTKNIGGLYFSLPIFFLSLSTILWFSAQRHVGNFTIDMPYTVMTTSLTLSILIALVVYLMTLEQTQEVRLSDQTIATERMSAVLNATSDFVANIKPDGTFSFVNTPGKQMLGHEGTPLPFPSSMLYSAQSEQFFREVALQHAAQKGIWQGETTLLHATGREIPISQVIISETNEKGDLVSFSTIIRDITHEKSNEERLRTGNRVLEQNKDDFLSIAAHQMRTPLGSAKWRLEMLAHGDFGKLHKEAEEEIQQLLKSNQRMITLVNNLLDVSCIEEKRKKDKPMSVPMPDIIKRVAQELTPEAESRGISFSFTYKPKEVLPITVDAERAYAVIENLLSNAVKYNTIKGNVSIHIVDTPEELTLEIKDTGIGIPDEEKKHLFTKFFRAPNAVRTDTDGSGLGLYVVKSYVTDWGGSVTCVDNTPSGSIFTVKIPRTSQPV